MYVCMYVCICMYVCMYVCIACTYVRTYVRMFVCLYIFIHIGAMRNRPKLEDCYAREHDFERRLDEILRMLRKGARFFAKFSGCSI